MAEGWLAVSANAALDAQCAAYPWLKLHTGAPGSAGTANAATETTRKAITEGAAASGVVTTTADMTWTNVAATEDYTHCSRLTASVAGTPGMTGTVTANPVVAGDTFSILSGQMTTSVELAS